MSDRKRGRPQLPEEDKRDNSVRIRLTRSEFKDVKDGAVTQGVTVSDYIREKIKKGEE